MPRRARIVLPGVAHHVTCRGNRRQKTFFDAPDYRTFETLLGQYCAAAAVDVLAYCLMPNHWHLILRPRTEASLSRAVGNAKEAYSRLINAREGWQGHLWQGRYFSVPLGLEHLYRAARYVLENPVRAGLAARPGDWPFSSYTAHRNRACPRGIVDPEPLAPMLEPWLNGGDRQLLDDLDVEDLRMHTRTGRPMSSIGPCGKPGDSRTSPVEA
jgi:putative transposase